MIGSVNYCTDHLRSAYISYQEHYTAKTRLRRYFHQGFHYCVRNDKTIPTAAIAIMDPSLEYFLFTTTPSGPHAATLEIPSTPSHPYEPEQLALPPPEPREPYQPPKEFYTHSQIKNFLGPSPSELTRATTKSPLRFSAETLQIVTEAHRILSHETNQLGLAAADLFRRCERLRSELYDQVIKVREIAARVDAVTGDDGRDGEAAFGASAYGEVVEDAQMFGAEKVDHRVMVANSNTKSLNERVERLRQKVAMLGGKELSAKERAFADEVSRLQASLAQGQSQMSDPPSPSPTPAPVTPDTLLHIPNSPASPSSNGGSERRRDKKAEGSLTARFTEIDDMQENLVKQANRAVQRLNEQREGEERKQAGGGVAAEFRKQRLQQVMAMLERETALVDAVTDRLGRLGVGL